MEFLGEELFECRGVVVVVDVLFVFLVKFDVWNVDYVEVER